MVKGIGTIKIDPTLPAKNIKKKLKYGYQIT